MNIRVFACSILVLRGWSTAASATDIIVTSEAEFAAALASASDGDRILLAPGTCNGGFFQSGVVFSGSLTDLDESDYVYQVMVPSPTANLLKQKVDIIFQAEAETNSPANFSFRVESKMAGGLSSDVAQRTSLWN